MQPIKFILFSGIALRLSWATSAAMPKLRKPSRPVNNGEMVVMQKPSPKLEDANSDIKLIGVVLEENMLRQRATADIAPKGGQFKVMTMGTYQGL